MELTENEGAQSNLPVILAARAAAYNNQGDYANSLRDASRAIDLMGPRLDTGNLIFLPQETTATFHLVRANALINLREKEKAIPDLKIVLQYDPKHRGALHLLAIAEGRKETDD